MAEGHVAQSEVAELARAIGQLNLGQRAMGAMEFITVDDHQPTSELMEPDLVLIDTAADGEDSVGPTQSTSSTNGVLDRGTRRIARQATDLLVTLANARGIPPRAVIEALDIRNPTVIDRLERASRMTIDLNVIAEELPDNDEHLQASETIADEAELLAMALELLNRPEM
ncbi:unnamed protein product [Closterium sp. Yama58-4]|nr:unnamed protein product [Closterium sp. Yama58-4]